MYLRDDDAELEEEVLLTVNSVREDGGSEGDGKIAASDGGNFPNKEDDDATEVTAVGSLEGDSSTSSDGNLGDENLNWTSVVNGTRYVGNFRPTGNSSFPEIADAKEDSSELIGETTKERNRRLLIQERIFQAGRKKVKKTKRSVRNSNQVQTLQTIDEDTWFEGRSIATDVTEEEESMSCVCLREAEIVLREKGRLLRNTKRVRRRQRKKMKVRGSSVRGMMVGYWRLAKREFSYIIQLYASSAVRYARFPSNRRFKPGD